MEKQTTPITADEIRDRTADAIEKLLAMPNVRGVDIGFKYKGGERTEEICLRVHVARKKKRIKKTDIIPSEVNGIATDVLEGRFDNQLSAFVPRRYEVVTQEDTIVNPDDQIYPVLQGGICISVDVDGGAETGTLGAIVKDNVTGRPAILTNGHVVKNTVGREVYHTYSWKTSSGGRLLGKVTRSRMTNGIDAAIIPLDGTPTYSFDIAELGGIQGVNTTPMLGTKVRKRGRTSRLTYGIIDGLHGTFADPTNISLNYNDIMTIAPTRTSEFSTFGDSGSTVLDLNNRIVGLLYSGFPPTGAGDLSGKTLVIPIQNVMRAMNVTVISSDNEPDVPAVTRVRATLKIGARGQLVIDLQNLLNKAGYKVDNDGVFGKMTRGIIQQFQLDNRLLADGVVGPKSWAALDNAAARRA
ncbi:MAG: hypothetical protein RL757_2535 [Bacteroidota bacterium]